MIILISLFFSFFSLHTYTHRRAHARTESWPESSIFTAPKVRRLFCLDPSPSFPRSSASHAPCSCDGVLDQLRPRQVLPLFVSDRLLHGESESCQQLSLGNPRSPPCTGASGAFSLCNLRASHFRFLPRLHHRVWHSHLWRVKPNPY